MSLRIDKNGDRYWYNSEGEAHREDGPAVELSNGYKAWCVNDKTHREDGPAIEYNNGDKVWCLNGKLHRIDGPAVERSDGTKAWYLNGKIYTEEEYKMEIKRICL